MTSLRPVKKDEEQLEQHDPGHWDGELLLECWRPF